MSGGSQQLIVNMKDEATRLDNRQTRFLNDLDISKGGMSRSLIILVTLIGASNIHVNHTASPSNTASNTASNTTSNTANTTPCRCDLFHGQPLQTLPRIQLVCIPRGRSTRYTLLIQPQHSRDKGPDIRSAHAQWCPARCRRELCAGC